MSTLTKQDAESAGLTKFFTDKPCKRGHIASRYVSTGACYECMRVQPIDAGTFRYEDLHPDDHAEARAFCQALDLQRGRTPK